MCDEETVILQIIPIIKKSGNVCFNQINNRKIFFNENEKFNNKTLTHNLHKSPIYNKLKLKKKKIYRRKNF